MTKKELIEALAPFRDDTTVWQAVAFNAEPITMEEVEWWCEDGRPGDAVHRYSIRRDCKQYETMDKSDIRGIFLK